MELQVKTSEVLQSILNEIKMENTYILRKWWFEVTKCNDPKNEGWFIKLAFERPDTETGEIGVGRGRAEFVAFGAWESGVVKTGWLLLELLVRHELMEGFRYKGCRIFNPHHSVSELMQLEQGHPH